jgi:hypothetical protein
VSRVDRTGWHELNGHLAFVLPDQSFGGPQTRRLSCVNQARTVRDTRSLKDWQDTVVSWSAGIPGHVSVSRRFAAYSCS